MNDNIVFHKKKVEEFNNKVEVLAKAMIKEAVLTNATNVKCSNEFSHKELGNWKFKAELIKEVEKE